MFIVNLKESKCLTYGIDVHSLKPGVTILAITKNNLYKIVKEEGDKYDVLVQGGKLFPCNKKVKFTGSTFGGSMLKIGWIGKGMFMEMYSIEDKKSYVTTAVSAAKLIGSTWEYDMDWED